MKAKNHSEHRLLELAVAKAANEDGISPAMVRETPSSRRPAWSPAEVWRTRVKTPVHHESK
jgi:hypothetical protein